MAQKVPNATVAGDPFAKLVSIGDRLVGAYSGSMTRQQRKYGDPKVLLTKDNGAPRLEEVMWLVAMPGTTAVTGNLEKGDTAPVKPGDHVRYVVSGFRWGQVIEARKALPAFDDFRAGELASSDVYTFTVTGFSTRTDNADAARRAGYTVENGRIIMRSQDQYEAWAMQRIKHNQPANAARELDVTVRRIDRATEADWERAADELFAAQPWKRAAQEQNGGDYEPEGPHPADTGDPAGWEEPF